LAAGSYESMNLDEAAFAAGAEAAKSDLAAGRPAYRWSGHSGHWGHWIVGQLADRYGIAVSDGFGVCFVDAKSASYDRGYNEVLAAEIDRRHGPGALEAVFADARKQSEETLGDAKRDWFAKNPDAPGASLYGGDS
jgi:hypothetical protein